MIRNSLHRYTGLLTIFIFLLTGLYMRRNFPSLYSSNESIRYMFRANHVYILLAGLLNIVVGTYLALPLQKWRRSLQWLGSILMLTAPVLLIVAFFKEPPRGAEDKPITTAGIAMLLLGTVCHMPSHGRRREAARTGAPAHAQKNTGSPQPF